MKSYSTTNILAAKIISMNREGANTRLVMEAPEVGAESATFEVVTAQWVKDNVPVIGGYLINKAEVLSYMPAASFEGVFVAVP